MTTIYYYAVTGYEEDGTEIYGMETMICETQDELEWALAIINDEDIFDIR